MTEENRPNCTQDHTSSPHAASQLFFLRQEFFFPSPPLDGWIFLWENRRREIFWRLRLTRKKVGGGTRVEKDRGA